MIMNDDLKLWLEENHIKYSTRADLLFIKGWGTAIIQDMEKREHLFAKNKDGEMVFDCCENYDFMRQDNIFYVVFKFGIRWYYVDIREENMPFHVLKYVGQPYEAVMKCDYYPLGIHTGYELLNGSGLIKNWVAKAKHCGYKGIGVCDRNTLASSIELQMQVEAGGISHCFGYSLTVSVAGEKIGGKVYVSSDEGWLNLLNIQKIINVDRRDSMIELTQLLSCASGNCFVFDKWSGQFLADNEDVLAQFIDAFDGWVYFQVDTTEYRADRIDRRLLNSLKVYFDNFYIREDEKGIRYKHNLRPVLIQDVYYIDKDDHKNKVLLNKVDKKTSHEVSYGQYMKNLDELYAEFRGLFSEKYSDEVFFDMCASTADIAESCHAKYDLSENYAPRYDMTEMEKLKYGNVRTMFNELIEEGFQRLVPKDKEEIYRKQLEYEKYVIESTDNIDYYLIVWDEVNWAKTHGIAVGVGRGSAGGCLISFLMGITNIDPLYWGLIFERFLLPERAGLAPREVTKVIDGTIRAKEYIELTMENGRAYRFDRDAKFMVNREGREMTVYADELEEGDDIIFDNRDMLFTLDELGEQVNV